MALPSPEVQAYFLEHGRNAIVATNRRNAGPNMSPFWYLWDGEYFLISTSDGVAKVRTLRRDPHMSICIDDPTSNLGLYVTVYGTGEVLGPGEPAVEPSIRLIRKYRYTDEASWLHWKEINAANDRVIIRMRPEQWLWRDL
jgi:PPOX class probable F420-dependent enzyme